MDIVTERHAHSACIARTTVRNRWPAFEPVRTAIVRKILSATAWKVGEKHAGGVALA